MLRGAATAIAVAFAAGLSPAAAADLLTVPTSTGDAVSVAGGEFDWTGFYAGVYGLGQLSQAGGQGAGIGLDLGYAARFEMVLVGGEVAIEGVVDGLGTAVDLQSVGRLGLALTDDIVVYGAAGGRVAIGGPAESDLLIGGGVAFAVTDTVSVDARYLHAIPVTGAEPRDTVSVGANFHF